MACGLKKQNNQLNGVHLTERTCSPYNPIIRLIVDDCLGLPVYPISSIDAVIDEDGLTLRQLLENIQSDINNKATVQEIYNSISTINNIIDNLGDTYISDEALQEKLLLLYRISALSSDTTLNENSQGVYKEGTTTPHIVDVVNRLVDLVIGSGNPNEQEESLPTKIETLKSLVWAISALTDDGNATSEDIYSSGTTPEIVSVINSLRAAVFGDEGGNDSPSLPNTINSLKSLLLAVANFDTNYDETIDDLIYDDNRIKIIKEILDLKTLLGEEPSPNDPVDPTVDPTDLSTIIQKVEWLISNVENLLNDRPYAHLEESLHEEGINKLRGSEYPVTSAYFFGDKFGIKLFGDKLEAITGGSGEKSLFLYFPKNSIIGYNIDSESPLKKYDYNNNDALDCGDISLLIAVILGDSNLAEALLENSAHILDIDGGGLSISDINAFINLMLLELEENGASTQKSNPNWSGYIYLVIRPAIYHSISNSTTSESNTQTVESLFPSGFRIIPHPLVSGKLYVDLSTDCVYKFLKTEVGGLMLKVEKFEFQGENGISVRDRLLCTEEEREAEEYEGPSNTRVITLGFDENTLPSTLHAKHITELEIPEDAEEGDYFLYEGLYSVIPSLGKTISENNGELDFTNDPPFYIENETGKVVIKTEIENVTDMIDALLMGAPNKTISNVLTEDINALFKNLEDELKTHDKPNNYSDGPTAWVDQVYATIHQILSAIKHQFGEDDYIDIRLQLADVNLDNSNLETNEEENIIPFKTLVQRKDLLELLESLDVYYCYTITDENEHQINRIIKINVSKPSDIRTAWNAMYDYNNDGVFSIVDIIAVIDDLLSNITKKIDVTNIPLVALNASLLLVKNNSFIQRIANEDDYDFNRLIRVDYPDNYDISDQSLWWHFDVYGVSPAISNFQLSYTEATKRIELIKDGIIASTASMASTPKSFVHTTNNSTTGVVDMGRLGTPYLFGEYIPSPSVPDYYNNGIILSGSEFTYIYDGIDDAVTGNYATLPFALISNSNNAPLVKQVWNKVNAIIEQGEYIITDNNLLLTEQADLWESLFTFTESEDAICLDYEEIGHGYGKGYVYNVTYTLDCVFQPDHFINNYAIDNDPKHYIEIGGIMKINSVKLISPDTVYYFPTFGLSIKFIEKTIRLSINLVPVIVNVETKNDTNTAIASNTGITYEVYPNERLTFEAPGLVLDLSNFIYIPAFDSICVTGIIKTQTDFLGVSLDFGLGDPNYSGLKSNLNAVTFNDDTCYKYTINNGLCIFEELCLISDLT